LEVDVPDFNWVTFGFKSLEFSGVCANAPTKIPTDFFGAKAQIEQGELR